MFLSNYFSPNLDLRPLDLFSSDLDLDLEEYDERYFFRSWSRSLELDLHGRDFGNIKYDMQ
jgi:hypothetical protein